MDELAGKELRKLAWDIANNQVFCSWMLRDINLLRSVFMPLIFMDKKQIEDMEKQKVVHFCEYYDKAGKMAINGHPIFWSFKCITENEMEQLSPMIDEILAKQKEFVGGESPPEGTAIQVR